MAAAESLKENHRYTGSNKISMSPLLVSVGAREKKQKLFFFRPIDLSKHALLGGSGGGGAAGKVAFCPSLFLFLFIEMRAKLKGSLLEEPHLWTQDDAIKDGRY